MTTCWCGTKNAYFAPVYGQCSGTGSIECMCGGDFCVCHNHGETECPGCDACDQDEREDDLDLRNSPFLKRDTASGKWFPR